MRTALIATVSTALLAVLVIAATVRPGSLTLENQTDGRAYCAVFDLWSLSGPEKQHLHCGPEQIARFEAPLLQAIGKIAIYELGPGTSCDTPPDIPAARHDARGLLLPTRTFAVNILPDASIQILELN